MFFAVFVFVLCKWRANKTGTIEKLYQLSEDCARYEENTPEKSTELTQENAWQEHIDSILLATNKFSMTSKLGQGGFGSVYKGKLKDGKEVAVKRLSSTSAQGVEEFKNEIILISKLQHRNLVKLILVYECLSNKSLDTFLFDSRKKAELDWGKRFQIIQGIARGLLYLHRDSCCNFGLARMFEGTQVLVNTRKIVGTLGYMSPKYAMGGIFFERSDVYSFGVLLLEIVSGKKNTSLYD
ncbi:hypothetical protein EUGRSUZ_E03457 [Eucalyptus grandis]|uniref:Uncharacterized protein n=2 Tax=Eucalyptus grandis TaxID=71139 RepID=A0ACC3KZ84_EUCGR|nr:hypothetical protein EUGRSUZ_E03457 [Eucalyptus grandis]